jgi:DNA-binding winged helix-turn-helix (wHTH) protein
VPELLTQVWGPEYRDDLQYLRVWISRVRRKLGAAPGEAGPIKTFQGIGYVLDVEGNLGESTTSHAGSTTTTTTQQGTEQEPAEATA